jgi:hypothetical protein
MSSNTNLTRDQRQLIDMYISQYNQTNAHIERLLDMLDDIRENIQNVVNTRPQTRARNTTSNRQTRPSNHGLSYILSDADYQNYYNIPLNTRRTYINNRFLNETNYDTNNYLNSFLNTTVPVRPSSEQIRLASRVVRYGDIENPLSTSCPISLEAFCEDDMVTQLLPCEHLFCTSSFQQWFTNNVRCPVCRFDIRNYRPQRQGQDQTHDTNFNTTVEPSPTPTTTPTSPTSSSIPTIPTNIPVNANANATTDLVNNLASRLFQSILSSPILNDITNDNDRVLYDASNNVLLFESIIRPHYDNNPQ